MPSHSKQSLIEQQKKLQSLASSKTSATTFERIFAIAVAANLLILYIIY